MHRELQLFLCALQFLTRLPVPHLPDFETDWITRSAKYFPVAGQLVGGLCAGVLVVASSLWSGTLPALLAVAVGVLITGAFHEDGLADTADGLGGGKNPAQRLAIMKDSRIGTYGTLAIIFCISIKVMAFASFEVQTAIIILIASHGAGRAAAVMVMFLVPYAGDPETAKAKPAAVGVTKAECLLVFALGLWPLLLLSVDQALLSLAACCVFAGLVALVARRLIGGYTGDVLGATEEVFEIGFLLAAAAVS